VPDASCQLTEIHSSWLVVIHHSLTIEFDLGGLADSCGSPLYRCLLAGPFDPFGPFGCAQGRQLRRGSLRQAQGKQYKYAQGRQGSGQAALRTSFVRLLANRGGIISYSGQKSTTKKLARCWIPPRADKAKWAIRYAGGVEGSISRIEAVKRWQLGKVYKYMHIYLCSIAPIRVFWAGG
jgi:hypothetical protein